MGSLSVNALCQSSETRLKGKVPEAVAKGSDLYLKLGIRHNCADARPTQSNAGFNEGADCFAEDSRELV